MLHKLGAEKDSNLDHCVLKLESAIDLYQKRSKMVQRYSIDKLWCSINVMSRKFSSQTQFSATLLMLKQNQTKTSIANFIFYHIEYKKFRFLWHMQVCYLSDQNTERFLVLLP